MTADCHFYILNRDDPGDSHSLWISNNGGGWLTLDEPPLVGDLIFLSGQTTDPADESGERTIQVIGTWRVLARSWGPATFGSPAWQTGDRQPAPVWLDVMVERAEGIFDNSHYGVLSGRTQT